MHPLHTAEHLSKVYLEYKCISCFMGPQSFLYTHKWEGGRRREGRRPLLSSPAMSSKAGGADGVPDVTAEDQKNINTFGRLASLQKELKAEIAALEVSLLLLGEGGVGCSWCVCATGACVCEQEEDAHWFPCFAARDRVG